MQRKDRNVYSISPSQLSNPVWKHLPLSNKIDENQISDMILHESKLSIIFLSLSFFYEYPLYLKGRMEEFTKSADFKNYPNRFLLFLHDRSDANDFFTEIMNMCFSYEIKILVGFSYEEIANYLRAFRFASNNMR